MLLPDYKLVGVPGKFRNGHRKKAKCFAQKYRLLAEVPRKVRSVSLATTDLTTARRRATRYVEDAIRKHLIASNPEARTASRGIGAVLKEYTDDLTAWATPRSRSQWSRRGSVALSIWPS